MLNENVEFLPIKIFKISRHDIPQPQKNGVTRKHSPILHHLFKRPAILGECINLDVCCILFCAGRVRVRNNKRYASDTYGGGVSSDNWKGKAEFTLTYLFGTAGFIAIPRLYYRPRSCLYLSTRSH